MIELNRAVAVAMRDGPEAGLALIEPLLAALPGYHAAPAARPSCAAGRGALGDAEAHYRARASRWPARSRSGGVLQRRLAELGA